MQRLSRFARLVLAWNVAVILWGAYVRASGSGAGCGAHWPLCNGEVLPRAASVATLVEFSHRLTSGVALLSVVALLVWAWRATAAGHPARRAAAWAMGFMLAEAAVGAGLVLFRLVADNATMARAMFMGAHLVNTFLLLASLTLTAWWIDGHPGPRLRGRGARALAIAGGFALLLLTGVSGAVAALGDTLFPSGSLAQALSADLSATSHLLVRLRVLHPTLAMATAIVLVAGASRALGSARGTMRTLAIAVIAAACAQVVGGFANVLLLAPVWMQIVHLLLADLVWIVFVAFAAQALAPDDSAERAASHAA